MGRRIFYGLYAVVCAPSWACSTSPIQVSSSVATGVFVQLNIQGNGSVVSSPAGIQCTGPLACDPVTVATQGGSVVNLLGTPAPGSTFVGWTLSAGANAHYSELVNDNGQPGSMYDAECFTDYPTQGSTGEDLTHPTLTLPAGSLIIASTSVSCSTAPDQAPAASRSINVPIAYLITATFSP